MINKKKFVAIVFLSILFFSLGSNIRIAYGVGDGTTAEIQTSALDQLRAGAGVEPGSQPADPRLIAAGIIKILLSLLGIIFTVLMIFAGYWYFTSHGEEDKLTKAKGTIRTAIWGLIITLTAFAIVQFVINALQSAVTNQ